MKHVFEIAEILNSDACAIPYFCFKFYGTEEQIKEYINIRNKSSSNSQWVYREVKNA